MAGAIQIKRFQSDLFVNKNLNILQQLSKEFKNAAYEAGFGDEAELQEYAKNTIRKEIYEERYGKSDD